MLFFALYMLSEQSKNEKQQKTTGVNRSKEFLLADA